MAVHGRSTLRDLFDDSPTPHIAHPPRTHRRHFYVATDGSYRHSGGGLGAVIETRDGTRVARLALPDAAPDNNVAEYRALHLGLDVLADRAPADARVGVLVDLDDLAANVNRAVLAAGDDWQPGASIVVPDGSEHHWRGIRARIAGFDEIRAARIDGRENPAHPLANAPEEYAHVNARPDRCVLPPTDDAPDAAATGGDPGVPPPSRAERSGAD
ncbi:MAG: ribonuclease H [Haloferacaceae archaeon]